MQRQFSNYLNGLETWQYEVSGGFTLRGYFTPPTGKPLLHFIHGNGFNGLVYEKFLAPFQAHFDLFISNAQGHGRSDVGGVFESWDTSAQYFTEVWQHYSALWGNVEKVGMGHSFGAVNTLLMTRLDPTLFDRVVLLDPIMGSAAWSFMANAFSVLGLSQQLPMVKQAKVRGTRWENRQTCWDYFYQRGTFKGWDDDCLQSYIDHALETQEDGSLKLICPPSIEASIFATYSVNIRRAMAVLNVPAHLYFGGSTYGFVQNELRALSKSKESAVVEQVEGGHCFMQQRPVEVANKVLEKLVGANANAAS